MPSLGELGAPQAAEPAGPTVTDEQERVKRTTFTFHGEKFTVADEVGGMPVMKYTAAALGGSYVEELAACYEFIRNTIDPVDWPRFEATATRVKAQTDELINVVGKVYAHLAGRPTERPSDSSDGPQPTSTSSRVDSSSPATRLGLVPVSQAMQQAASSG